MPAPNAFAPARLFILVSLALALTMTVSLPNLYGDEGMWLFNNPPRQRLKQRYGFEPPTEWLAHLQHSAVRFNDGGSGSFISADGLVLTNHHVGASALQKLSTPDHNYLNTGFHAKSRAEEIRAVDSELNVLQNIEDVTARVEAAVKPEHDAGRGPQSPAGGDQHDRKGIVRRDGAAQRRGHALSRRHLPPLSLQALHRRAAGVRPRAIDRIFRRRSRQFRISRATIWISACSASTKTASRQKSRIICTGAPTASATTNWCSSPGIPATPTGMDTVAHLDYIRDIDLPQTLERLFRKEVLLAAFSQRSRENARRAEHELFGVQNSRKARGGMLAGLQDPADHDAKEARRAIAPRRRAARSPSCTTTWRRGMTWPARSRSSSKSRSSSTCWNMASAFDCRLFRIARTLVRMPVEDAKPNAERLREFGESSRPSLEQQLFSTAPIYDDLETLKLADSLSMLVEKMGRRKRIGRERFWPANRRAIGPPN